MKILQVYKSLDARPDLYEYISTCSSQLEVIEVAVEQSNQPYRGTAQLIQYNQRKTSFLTILKLIKTCGAIKPDIIICHRRKYSLFGMLLNYIFTFNKVISVIHGDADYRNKKRTRISNLLRRKNTRFIAVSESTKKFVTKQGLHHVDFINNAIDVALYKSHLLPRTDACKELQLDKSKFIIGTIGRLADVKNQLFALKAFKNALEINSNLHLVIIGEGDQRALLERFILENKLNQSVTLTGAKNDAFKFVNAFDLGFLSSKTEGLALALLEILVANIPVVASDIPAFRDILPTQALFPLDKAQSFTQLMLTPPEYQFDITPYDRPAYTSEWERLLQK